MYQIPLWGRGLLAAHDLIIMIGESDKCQKQLIVTQDTLCSSIHVQSNLVNSKSSGL